MKNQAHFVSASGVVSTPALFHAAYRPRRLVRVRASVVEMFRNRETGRVSRNGSKVFTSALTRIDSVLKQ